MSIYKYTCPDCKYVSKQSSNIELCARCWEQSINQFLGLSKFYKGSATPIKSKFK